MMKVLSVVSALSLAATAVGCLSADEADEIQQEEAESEVLGTEQAQVQSALYGWNQSFSGDQLMGPDNNRFCFLSRVAGHFNGYGEWVRVMSVNNNWVIR